MIDSMLRTGKQPLKTMLSDKEPLFEEAGGFLPVIRPGDK
jgi:hypothetical protein